MLDISLERYFCAGGGPRWSITFQELLNIRRASKIGGTNVLPSIEQSQDGSWISLKNVKKIIRNLLLMFEAQVWVLPVIALRRGNGCSKRRQVRVQGLDIAGLQDLYIDVLSVCIYPVCARHMRGKEVLR